MPSRSLLNGPRRAEPRSDLRGRGMPSGKVPPPRTIRSSLDCALRTCRYQAGRGMPSGDAPPPLPR